MKELWEAASALGRPLQVVPDVDTRLEPKISSPMGPSGESELSLGKAVRPVVGMSEGELSEKAQLNLYCQDSYNTIKAHRDPLPIDKSQICWKGPRFLTVGVLVIPASCSLQSKYSGGELKFSQSSLKVLGSSG